MESLKSMNDLAVALADAAQKLEEISDTPRLDVELLMAHALGMERSDMLLQMRDLSVPDGFDALIARRIVHEPVAYIRGYQDFWDLKLRVTPDVLIPRADSETLIEAARDYFERASPLPFRGGVGGGGCQSGKAYPNKPHPNPVEPLGSVRGTDPSTPEGEGLRILDLGTGSGALLLAALSEFPGAHGTGIDASQAALAVAAKNAENLGFAKRTTFKRASWRDAGWCCDMGQFDLILCNPPYVETAAQLQLSVQDYEPHAALFAGEDGLDDYRVLMPQIPALMAPGGVALFEIGMGQESAVSDLAASVGLQSREHKDLAGIVRALSLTG
jgi:release factor glutamine methyltransferase